MALWVGLKCRRVLFGFSVATAVSVGGEASL